MRPRRLRAAQGAFGLIGRHGTAFPRGRAVLDQFYADQQPLAAHVTDHLLAHHAAQPVGQVGSGRGRAVGEAFGLARISILRKATAAATG
jgi:hypothetical protein